MQLLAHQSDVGPNQRELTFGFTGHGVTKTVVLANDVDTLERLVLFDHLHQRGHAHVGMGVKPEVPKTAFFVGQDRVNSRVIEKQHALAWLALVVFVDGLDQGRGVGRRVALHHKLGAVIDSRFERRHGLLGLAFAVVALQQQGSSHRANPIRAGQLHAAAGIDTLHSPNQITKDRLTGVGKRATQAFDHGHFDGGGSGLSHRQGGRG